MINNDNFNDGFYRQDQNILPQSQEPQEESGGFGFDLNNLSQLQLTGLLMATGVPMDRALQQSVMMQRQREEELVAQQQATRQQQAMQDFYNYIDGGVSSQNNSNVSSLADIMQAPTPINNVDQNTATLANINNQRIAPQQNDATLMQQNAQKGRNLSSNVPEDTRIQAKFLAQNGDIKGALELINKHQVTTKDAFDMENKLRDEFINQSKPWHEVNSAFTRVIDSASNPSPAGDIALIYNYMKMLDPGSVVREGEFATAQNAGSVPNSIRAKYNKLVSGETLSTSIRNDFIDRAQKLYEGQKKNQRILEKRYEKLANTNSLNPENIVLRYEDETSDSKPVSNMQSQSEAPAKKRSITELSDAELQAIINGQ